MPNLSILLKRVAWFPLRSPPFFLFWTSPVRFRFMLCFPSIMFHCNTKQQPLWFCVFDLISAHYKVHYALSLCGGLRFLLLFLVCLFGLFSQCTDKYEIPCISRGIQAQDPYLKVHGKPAMPCFRMHVSKHAKTLVGWMWGVYAILNCALYWDLQTLWNIVGVGFRHFQHCLLCHFFCVELQQTRQAKCSNG